MDKLHGFIAGVDPINWWLGAFLLSGVLAGVLTGYLQARKIQPGKFRWKTFRNEILFAVLNVLVSGVLIGGITKYLQHHGFITFNHEPASAWVLAGEFALYFIGFDTYFYWLHRLMHIEPIYTWVHKIHHRSLAPNPMTTFSVSPLESFINGGWVPLFTAVLTVHDSTMLLLAPFQVVMGLYVHSGFEFLPKWWNRTWLTKWFITATFHDQHHRYFKGNYGGFTTVWDWICGTVRPTYLSDYEKVTTRPIKSLAARRALAAEKSAQA